MLVAAVAGRAVAVRFPVVNRLRPDDDEIGIELGRNEIPFLFVPIPQAERGIMIEIHPLTFGKAKHSERHGKLDAQRDILAEVLDKRTRHSGSHTIAPLSARIFRSIRSTASVSA